MNIYKIESSNQYQFIDKKNYFDISVLNNFDGVQSYSDNWKPLKIYLQKKDYNNKKLLPDGDCIGFSDCVLILSEKAVEVLKDILYPRGEILPLKNKGKTKYFAYNCLKRIDGIDREKSTVDSILFFNECQFIYERVKDEIIFKDIGTLSSGVIIFVTDKFINRVLENNLTGFEFRHLWSSEGEALENIKT